jgi:hypothetical protein
MNPVSAMASGIRFAPKSRISDWEMRSAAPLSAMSFPNIAPRMMMMDSGPSMSPMPRSTLLGICSSGRPSIRAAAMAEMMKATKG